MVANGRPALRQFVDQLVEIADLAHQRFLDFLDTDAADRSPMRFRDG
jgi:hypothetical protein